ncbi:two-component sensor histidine kinase [Actinocatenispora thailandica]|uniref:Two-component sensor histidine kinase n=1 Tax=Actinocatenispora thailandica TaxID=227318 RepID=A0A7R7HWR0_9ACTN|nr:sensor histidine kinase [Actinocatenispora thailandica]BCJ35046.1 two-component sensor histidine kinase [Actinocatenispora thailandica]
MSDVTQDDFDWTPRRRRVATLLTCGWLGYLIPVCVAVAAERPSRSMVLFAAVGLAAYVVLFVRLIHVGMCRPFRLAAPYALVGLVAVGALLMIPIGSQWRYAFPYYLVAILPGQLPPRWWIPSQVGTLVVTTVVAIGYGDRGSGLIGYLASVAAVALFTSMFFWLLRTMVQLRRARAEMARLAVSEERLRIARDLHDVLGQRLAAVALLSDLAGRLAGSDPERARQQSAEAGRLAREALEEVRATVSGFRDTSLTGELSTAQALLAAAGIGCVLSAPEAAEVPGRLADVAGWVVREGVTNVVRHSRAGTVRIVVRSADPVVVEVADDGRGDATSPYGNGLTGLRERVTALGGVVRTERVDGWYRLRAELPAAAPGDRVPAAAGAA